MERGRKARTRGRGRGVRGGGRGASAETAPQRGGGNGRGGRSASHRGGGTTNRRPCASEEIPMDNIENLPIGVPLEVPLGPPPKRRRFLSPSRFSAAGCSRDTTWGATSSAIIEEVPSSYVEEPAAYYDMPHEPAVIVEYVDNDLDFGTINMTGAPSPALSAECGSGTASTSCNPPRRSLRELEILRMLHFGSEDETDSDDDEEEEAQEVEQVMSPFIGYSRRQEVLMETPYDDDDLPAPAGAGPVELPMEGMEPTNMYSFTWRAVSNLPIQPELRRETFSSISGPTTPMSDPYDIFVEIWDRPIMEHIAKETNRYAQQLALEKIHEHTLTPSSRICDWEDTTVDELYVFFGLLLAMGVLIKTKLEEYWSVNGDVFDTPGFRAHMSLRRFQILSRCLHFNNSEDMCGLELEVSEAKLFKIKPILVHCNKKFAEMYNLGQNISLDESLLQWKGPLSFKVAIPNKAASVGVKSYVVCESQTGYLWRFQLHAHPKVGPQPSAAQSDPMNGTIPALVLRLLEGLENKGHTVWMDNYYNSPALARKLKSLGFDVVGTLRTNRQFVPVEIASLTKGNMKPGDIKCVTSGDVDLMVWRDQNRVALLSTYHGNAVSGNPPKPILVKDYNVCMGGVDKKDQMLSTYPTERKRTKVWYKKKFRNLLNASVLNSYIIHKQSAVPNTKQLLHRSFRVNLINTLLKKHSQKTPPTTLPTDTVLPVVRELKDHYPAEYPIIETFSRDSGKKNGRARRRCHVCKKRTSIYCAGCNKPVCLLSCYSALHS